MNCLRDLTTTLVLFLIIIPVAVIAQSEEIKPLFNVGLSHEFPQAAETFEEIKALILENYYTSEISEEALYWAAIKGMLRHISPPDNPELSKIWTVEDYEKVFNSLSGVQVSLGVKSSLNTTEGSLTVTETLPGSPAEGVLLPYDRILRIDGESLKGKSTSEVNDLMNGEEGSQVTLTISRDIKVFDISLRREKFSNENLIITPLTDNLVLVEMKTFSVEISVQLKERLAELSKSGYNKLILDLRNNSGGVFLESIRAAEEFLPEKSILLRTFTRDKKLQNYVSSNPTPFDFKIAVLVSESTASAAEILSSALRDHTVALIIGTKTYGKGVFEKTYTLDNEFRVKFITGAMYTPKGIAWQSKGLKPDFLVEQSSDTLKALLKLDPQERLKKDVAMITAFKLLKGYDR